MVVKIDEEECIGCGSCVGACPEEALELDGDVVKVDPAKCSDCFTCIETCPTEAISEPQ